jgi:hypothetical protein
MQYRNLLLVAFAAALGVNGCADDTGAGQPRPSTSTAEPSLPPVPITANGSPATTPLMTLPPHAAVCDAYADITTDGALGAPELKEISGLAASRRFDDVLWVHNDSRGGASVYAVSTQGSLLATWKLDGVLALDWEDMSSGPGPDPGVHYLYVGDIGDNFALRSNLLVYRFPEPDATTDGTVTDFEVFRLSYPAPGANAEALAVDPVTGDLIVITKDRDGPEIVYRAPGSELRDGLATRLDPVATLELGGQAEVTAADFSPQGERIALRGYRQVWIWPRLDADLSVTFANQPCRAASPDEVQGEAIGFDASGINLFTISEGTGAAVNRIGIDP